MRENEPPPEALREDYVVAASEREDWALDAAPLHAAMNRSREMAFSFARFALGMLFLLNAGGIVGFPVLAQLVGARLAEHWPLALLGIGAFTIGVTCAAVATLLAFISMFADGLMIFRHLERLAPRDFDLSAFHEGKAELEKRLRRDMRMRIHALRFGLVSLAAFLVGAVFAALVLAARLPEGPGPLQVHAAVRPSPSWNVEPI